MPVATRMISIYDAKTHLSQLLTEIEEKSAEYLITRHGKPIAKIVPLTNPGTPRTPGALKGQLSVPDGWDEFSAEDEQLWYGE